MVGDKLLEANCFIIIFFIKPEIRDCTHLYTYITILLCTETVERVTRK